MSDLW